MKHDETCWLPVSLPSRCHVLYIDTPLLLPSFGAVGYLLLCDLHSQMKFVLADPWFL